MANLNFSSDNNGNLGRAKFGAFNTSASASISVGQKTQYTQVPAFYLGSEGDKVREHFPYVKDENGKKIPKRGSSTRYTEFERETTSDGWMFTLHTAGKDKLYVVTREKPVLEAGSYYLISGLGYGHGQYPTFLDESIKLEKFGQVTFFDSGEVVVNEEN